MEENKTFSLDDLSGGTEVSLDELNTPTNKEAVVSPINKEAKRNIASFSSALSPASESVDVYKRVMSEFNVNGSSETAINSIQSAREKDYLSTKTNFKDLLADPAGTPEQQFELGKQWLNYKGEVKNTPPTPQDLLTKESSIEPSQGNTQEDDDVRVDYSSWSKNINEYNSFKQQILSDFINERDTTFINKAADFAQLLVPFISQHFVGGVSGDIEKQLSGSNLDKVKGYSRAMLLLGSEVDTVRKHLRSLPLIERKEFIHMLVEAVKANESIHYNENQLLSIQYLQSVLQDDGYTWSDKVLDNIASVMDMTVLGVGVGTFARGLKTSKVARLKLMSEIEESVKKQSVKVDLSETSVKNVVDKTNPQQAKELDTAIFRDETGDLAEAVTGSRNKSDIAVDSHGPQIAQTNKSVRSKVTYDDDSFDISHLTKGERSRAVSNVKSKLSTNSGSVTQKINMTTVDNKNGITTFMTTFGSKNGGWKRPRHALNMVQYSLRDAGVGLQDLILLRKDKKTGDYLPTDLLTAKNEKGIDDYMVSLKYDYRPSVDDINVFDPLPVSKLNILDRFLVGPRDNKSGSLTRMLFDAPSLLSPTLFGSAARSIDRQSGLINHFNSSVKEYSKTFRKLPTKRKQLIDDTIRWQNVNSKALTDLQLKAKGHTDVEIAFLKSYRKTWDNIWTLENKVAARRLKNTGYKHYITKNDTKMFARPIPKNKIGSNYSVYDDVTDTIITLSKKDIDDTYKKGGTLASLRHPITKNGEVVDRVLVKNNASSYLRGVRRDDEILAYREGYYQVLYKNPIYITKTEKVGGKEITRAVATAGNRKDAELLAKQYSSQEPSSSFNIRRDRLNNLQEDSYSLDLHYNRGRMSEKRRGEALKSADDVLGDPAYSNALDPFSARDQSILSISKRASLDEWFSASEARFINQYSTQLGIKDKFGKARMPESIKEILSSGGTAKQRGDAVTTFEYIRFMQDGYINTVDDLAKRYLQTISEIAGEKHAKGGFGSKAAGVVEKEFSKVQSGPVASSKKLAAQILLGLNPLRQFPLQAGQLRQLNIIDPAYISSFKFTYDMSALQMIERGVNIPQSVKSSLNKRFGNYEDMVKEWDKSGMKLSGTNHHFFRQDTMNFASQFRDKSSIGKVGHVWDAVVDKFSSVGFQAGENIQLKAAWLTLAKKKFKETGKRLTPEDWEQVAIDARNFTGNFNKAGDFAYTQNWTSPLLQFMSAPHKLGLSLYVNKRLDSTTKAKLFAYNTVMYGVPDNTVTSIIADMLPNSSKETRDLIHKGVEPLLLNAFAEMISGDEVDLDWSSFQGPDLTGIAETIYRMLTTDIGAAAARTPSMQVLSKFKRALGRTAQLFYLSDDPLDQVNLGNTLSSWAEIAPGLSNAMKAKFILDQIKNNPNGVTKLLSKRGVVVDENISKTEAFARAFGLRTMDEVHYWNNRINYSTDKKRATKDAETFFRGMFDMMEKPEADFDHIAKMHRAGLISLKNVPPEIIQRVLMREFKARHKDGKFGFWNNVLRNPDLNGEHALNRLVDSISDPKERENVNKLISTIRENIAQTRQDAKDERKGK